MGHCHTTAATPTPAIGRLSHAAQHIKHLQYVIAGHLRAGHAVVSFVVSFVYVQRRSARTERDRQPRSWTLLNRGEPGPTDLESVWGLSPR
jgi:hypothetical protein